MQILDINDNMILYNDIGLGIGCNMTKPYQVKQVRSVIIKYRLGGDFDV